MMTSASSQLWDAMSAKSRTKGERNDCTVRALAVITGLDYDVCHAQLAKQGRKPRKGCYWFTEGPKAAKALGFDLRQMARNEYHAKTMITAERDRALQSGKYAILVSRHVAGMVDGDVIDWSQGKRKRIQAVYECTAIAGFTAPVIDRATIPAGSQTWQSFKKYKKADNLELF